jgi:hypothetical protein
VTEACARVRGRAVWALADPNAVLVKKSVCPTGGSLAGSGVGRAIKADSLPLHLAPCASSRSRVLLRVWRGRRSGSHFTLGTLAVRDSAAHHCVSELRSGCFQGAITAGLLSSSAPVRACHLR